MKNKDGIQALNDLITINNDRIECYKTALEITKDRDLKTLFLQFISNSQKCKQELDSEIKALGGKSTNNTKTTGKFFRVWMDVKAAYTGKYRKSILNSCEYAEYKTKEIYIKIIVNQYEYLSSKQRDIINTQILFLNKDYDHIKLLQESPLVA